MAIIDFKKMKRKLNNDSHLSKLKIYYWKLRFAGLSKKELNDMAFDEFYEAINAYNIIGEGG